jgi:hypothetical protein
LQVVLQHSQVLGPRAHGVPEEVHKELEKMALAGFLPITTPEVRQRHGVGAGTAGSEYGIPPVFRDAFRHGYIGPNLPAPAGWVWRSLRGGKWKLVELGG